MPKFTMPIGKSNFAKVRTAGDYYIDKTMLIEQITSSGAEVTLFTRPHRFGKSLNMSMLQHFFDCREESESLFEGLKVSKNKDLCKNWMNKYPTILVSFKDVDGDDYESAADQLRIIISKLYESHKYLIGDGSRLEQYEIDKFRSFLTATPSDVNLKDSLNFLTKLLHNKYNKQVILLIDEYDVPMAKGDANGCYPKITGIMRILLSQALKDNPYIKFAVLTGCLRIAEESIFTGLNNPSINTIAETGYDECFGFTNEDMNKLLTDIGLMEKMPVFKEWYDGYIFGNREVYCPWDVLNYVDALQTNPNQPPMNYWANTSGNDIIKRFLDSNIDVNKDFETLLSGDYIEKRINPNITYSDLTDDDVNLWSVLYMTGYLTIVRGSLPKMTSNDPKKVKGMFQEPFKLRLPNNEIKMMFEETVAGWFKNKMLKEDRTELFKAIWNGDTETITDELCGFLGDSISFYDYHEIFYHAFLTGLLSGVKGISVKSNSETGTGRADVVLQYPRKGLVAIFEFKSAKSEAAMSKRCDEALKQIDVNRYSFPFRKNTIFKYGIAFFEKQCLVKKG